MKTKGYSTKLQFVTIGIVFAVSVVVWFVSYVVGFANYQTSTSSQNYGSVIQGMSALLGIVIAAAIFRIQSLENRLQSLEESTLDYVYKIIGHSYPVWDERLENSITNESITQTYLKYRLSRPSSVTTLVSGAYQEDARIQQEGLQTILEKHNSLRKTIDNMKHQVLGVSIILLTPIVISFIMLMSTDSLTKGANFFMVAFVVYLSILGIVLLLSVVYQSMFQKVDT
jgi:amino acid permease